MNQELGGRAAGIPCVCLVFDDAYHYESCALERQRYASAALITKGKRAAYDRGRSTTNRRHAAAWRRLDSTPAHGSLRERNPQVNATDTVIAVPSRAEQPIRAEIFGIERLEQHAESLAAAQRTTGKPRRGRQLLPRVRENGRVLVAAYRNIVEAVQAKRGIAPAEEWLLDNFFVVDEQLRGIRDHLPGGYYRLLPKIAEGHLEGYPRVYGLAWAYVAHTDSRFELETLQRFVRAYQRVQPLTIGEIWAVAIHLRVALVENLRRLAEQIIGARHARAAADELADRLLGLSGRPAEDVDDVLGLLGDAPVVSGFAVELVQRLRDRDPSVMPALVWLNERLSAQGTTVPEVVAQEHHAHGAANVTVRNIITSMRWMSSIDWFEFFESVSLVDEVLRATPGFTAMDFATRNEYRTQIELLSRGAPRSEIEVAQEAVLLAQHATRAHEPPDGARAGVPETEPRLPEIPERAEEDPGYHLIGGGRRAFERLLRFRVPVRLRLHRATRALATTGYLAGIAALTALVLAVPLVFMWRAGASPWSLVLLGILGLVPASDVALSLVHRLVPVLVPPRLLPKLELARGVPPELRTVVVVPTLLSSQADIEEQLERLEVHFLANPDGDIFFALLSDWADAPRESMPNDAPLLAALAAGIERLNERYDSPPGAGERFLLLHRRRLWNEKEGKWIGWERKRGKLHELNRLLRGATDTTFIPINGRAPTVPDGVRYVITLDADTRLPKGTAYRLVGAMAHPLNRPRFDARKARVVQGYAVLQPRITPSLPTGPRSTTYQRIISGPGGVDPYAAAVSDVYQDLFEEGSYTGKGIYDVDAFELALEGKVLANALLSHDLFEGLFARAGLVTDIDLFEEFPANYEVAARRHHRWVRGDWQLLPWVLGHARDAQGRRLRVPIRAHARWKMMDNLRRSLVAPFLLFMVMAAWVLPGAPLLLWTGLFVGAVALPAFIPVFDGLIPRRRGISKRNHFHAVGHDTYVALAQTLLAITMLAHQAWLMLDAVARTLWRLYVTKRNLLEWVAAAHQEYGVDLKLWSFFRHLRWGVVLAAAAGTLCVVLNLGAWPVAAPLVLLWVLSPVLAWRMSLPPEVPREQILSPGETRTLRLIARRTWRFFETFVDDGSHALPPDNFQEDPEPAEAPRTSPTNLGLYLLSTTVAHDFGWIGTLDMVERLEATLKTMTSLRRLRGHFFNWYDTRDLRPLDPMYVSTVDSGNLAGHLIALAQACRERMDRPLVGPEVLEGIRDALQLVLGSAERDEHPERTQTVTTAQLRVAAEGMAAGLDDPPTSLPAWVRRLAELDAQAEILLDIARTLASNVEEGARSEALVWAQAVRNSVRSHARDLATLVPWCTRLCSNPPAAAEARAHNDDAAVLVSAADANPTPAGVPELCRAVQQVIEQRVGEPESEGRRRLLEDLEASRTAAAALEHRTSGLALQAERMVRTMDFRFLFDSSRKLFSIGYRVADGTLDPSCYDLLASEARLASFVAVAKGDVTPRHWFLLGRSLTPVGRGAALLSWSGSMFEYLMPLLVMRQPALSLLDLSCRLVVRRQIQYGAERRVPWGVSESAYNVRDLKFTFQYSDFGVPGLGLKRGLFEDVVVAPYATALAAMVDPRAALINFGRLDAAGALGGYGYYEALDYTPSRLPEQERVAVVRAYMAHHQGMTIVSLGNVVHNGRSQSRFHAHPMVQATELLLQERTPRSVAVARPRGEEVQVAAHVRDLVLPTLRRFESPHDITPRTHVLSNGRYTVMLTAAGSGFSRWRDLAVTRWREDTTRDSWGTFIFLRDAQTGEIWSAGFQPSGTEADHYAVVYSEDRAKIRQAHRSLMITLEVVVSPEDDAELRRLAVTNLDSRDREIDVTSYAEVVLAPQGADMAHPAFSNLFVETEFVPELATLLATRRPRSADQPHVWLAHLVAVEGGTVGALQYESDRARFLGRGRGIRTPLSVIDGGRLSNTAGPVLDPIVSLRHRVALPRGETVHLVFTTLVAPSREEALEIAEKYRQPATFERESSLAWTQAQVQLHHLRTSQDEAHLFQRLVNRLLYTDPTLRASTQVLTGNRTGPSGLWAYGISGDLPIVLVRIERDEERDVVRQLVRAHEYWYLKGIPADLVILNAQGTSYVQDLQESLEALVRTIRSAVGHERRAEDGGVFLLRADLVPERDEMLLLAAARVVILASQGTLSEQVVRVQRARPGPVPPRLGTPRETAETVAAPILELAFFNGLGGFTADGREYVTALGKGQWTPAPWINVIANPEFGCQISESGSGYTWSVNSRENKLTPWSNDPVSDTPGETFYVRDEDSGLVWGPTLLPIREESWPYVIRHGQGYSRFEHASHGIALELLQFVPLRDHVKISRLTLENRSNRTRRLGVTAYTEWVLGVERSRSAPSIVTEVDPKTRAMFARNALNEEFADRVAFADLGGRQTSWTGDRLEFLGRNASLDHPSSLERGAALSRKTGPGLDPCAALQTKVELEPGERAEVLFLLGQGSNREEARALVERYRTLECDTLLNEVQDHWNRVLGSVQVETPDASMNLLLNRWLLYQTLSCRIWARSAFYQSSGAYGFRDQLQDVLALAVARPDVVREHLLRAAARQFTEGDVQHWWHPSTGRGVRTRISDDLLWLPYAANHYLTTTEDWAVLDERVPWLEGRSLEEHEQEAYFVPKQSEERATLYEHCARALDRSLAAGSHGLPLIGAGDWNDGMNRVGREGRGESVWLGWFLHLNLTEFARIADRRADAARAERWRERAAALQVALEGAAWDGEWYRRAFFDDGTPLGSAESDECQIDSIPQSWAVLSGAADEERARRAMENVERRLVRWEDRLVLLFSPPFDKTPMDPGYIKGYLRGIRENGGQYTHAAIWSVVAFAMLGEGDKAVDLFNLLNPIYRASRRADVHRYKVEPYAVPADVYSEPPHVGRGGWTWYTGAAGWLYRAGVESILGLRKRGSALCIDPCIPRSWKRFAITYRHGGTLYRIAVENPKGVCRGVSRVSLDGTPLPGGELVPLCDDGGEHRVEVVLG
jgi:cyclic beta-1,2-glucan synthetase